MLFLLTLHSYRLLHWPEFVNINAQFFKGLHLPQEIGEKLHGVVRYIFSRYANLDIERC